MLILVQPPLATILKYNIHIFSSRKFLLQNAAGRVDCIASPGPSQQIGCLVNRSSKGVVR
jgi:hypothetical protein